MEFKKILVLENQSEAHLMEAALQERNIPHIIRSYHDSAYDGLFQQQKGWGYLAARAEDEEEIRKIYQDLRSA